MPPPTISELMQIPNGYKTAEQTLSDAIARRQQMQMMAYKQQLEQSDPQYQQQLKINSQKIGINGQMPQEISWHLQEKEALQKAEQDRMIALSKAKMDYENYLKMQDPEVQLKREFYKRLTQPQSEPSLSDSSFNPIMRNVNPVFVGKDMSISGIDFNPFNTIAKTTSQVSRPSLPQPPEGFDYSPNFLSGFGGNPYIKRPIDKSQSASEIRAQMAIDDIKRRNEDSKQAVLSSAQDTLETISEIEKNLDFFGIKSFIPAIPGSEKANWDANINKLLSQNIINVMNSMKQASKTGATGFGQLSNKELEVLRGASTALKKNLSKEDAVRYLGKMKAVANKILVNQESGNKEQSIGAGGSSKDYSSLWN